MKIGIVLPSVPGYSETFFKSKIKGLQAAGFEVTLFVKNPSGSKNFICPVVVHPIIKSNPLLKIVQAFYVFAKMVQKAPVATVNLIKEERSSGSSLFTSLQSVVIASSILPYKLDWLHFGFATTALQREKIAKSIGAKMAVSFRGYDICVVPIKQPNCYQELWKYIDKVHTISDDLTQTSYKFGLPKTVEVTKITPAIRVENFGGSEIIPTKNTMLSVGRLHWKKGIPYLLKAIQILAQKGIKIQLKIVGDGDELERLKFAVHQLGLEKNVTFVGKLSHSEIPLAMAEAEIYIQYSNQEGFCNAVLEAQASGLLCIASDAEGLPENIVNNKTGWIVPKRNPEALAQKIIEVLQMTEAEKAEIRTQARARIEQEFSIESQQQKFIEFYKS